MAAPVDVSMPQDEQIGANYVLRVTALDASTGSLVAGAKVSTVAIMAEPLGAGDLGSGSFVANPVLVRQQQV